MKTIIFNEIQARVTKSFLKKDDFLALDNVRTMYTDVQLYTDSCAGALRLLSYKCNPLIGEVFLFRVERNYFRFAFYR